MFERIEPIVDLLNVPFAIFQEEICIFESQITDSDRLSSLSKNFWSTTEMHALSLTHFRDLIFGSIKFVYETNQFLLTTILLEKNTIDWEESDWKQYFHRVQGAVSILSTTEELTIQETNYSGTSYHHKPNEQLSIDAIDELKNDFTENYVFEELFMHALKDGDTIVLNRLINNLISINRSHLSDDPLIEKKYRCVAFITVLTRKTIKYNCPATLSYRLSDHLIRKLDSIQQNSDFPSFIRHLITEFCNLIKVHEASTKSITVKLVEECIHQHLYKKISNQFIAKTVSVHPAYLSSVFKQEKGISLRNYINAKKIDEAKYLLTKTDLSFKEISASLHFSNQSYFCKLFKEHTMYTPKEFRLLF